ncbi:MAG: hypothetical protein ACPG52_07385 [Cognaticolwellia sp.]
MIKNQLIKLSAVLMMLFSLNVLAVTTDNPFWHSQTLTTKHLPKAFISMWQSEHMIWRAQLFNAACSKNNRSIKYAINVGFPLVNQYIVDQAIINDELLDEHASAVLHDSNKLYYRIFSEVYAYAYIKRLKVIQQYHPQVSADLCAHADKISQQYPADELPISPWQVTDQSEFRAWQADLFSMRVVNKHFVAAFIKRQQPFAHIIDGQIYAMMMQDKKAVTAFFELSGSAKYQKLLAKQIAQGYQQARGKKLSQKDWRAHYANKADVLASQAYALATVSALEQIKTLYPALYPKIEAHMVSYVELQRSTLATDKKRLAAMLNEG